MALNPHRNARDRAGAGAFESPSPFQAEADAGLAGFRTLRSDLERQVRRGDLTPKIAREQARAAADRLREQLLSRSECYSPTPRVFLDRLIEAAASRNRARDRQSLESLQRETNQLLRLALVEQQLLNRAVEFEGRAFVRSMSGGQPSPTLGSLLAFHESATQAGDDAAQEWARRQLEGMRSLVLDPDDLRRLDAACDRPERLNPAIVARYVEAMGGQPCEALEQFVAQALAGPDANACAAAFVLAREAPEGTSARWVRAVLDGLKSYPDAALAALRSWEAESRRRDADAARDAAERALATAEAESRMPTLEAPGPAELVRQARLRALPVANPDEPIGLVLQRRGLDPEDFEAAAIEPTPE